MNESINDQASAFLELLSEQLKMINIIIMRRKLTTIDSLILRDNYTIDIHKKYVDLATF